jgi:hypothetical protein
MKEIKEYDLHSHTIESDGTYTPEELVKRAKGIGLKGIAITDHDTIAGLNSGKKKAIEVGIDFIEGIEFSCQDGDLEVHILGYFLNTSDEVLKKELEKLIKIREERNIKILEKLQKYKIKLTMEELKNEAGGEIISKAHIANLMLKKGYVYTRNSAFKEYLGKDGVAYVPKKNFSPEEAVEIIVKNGGKASLAHPALITKKDSVFLELLERLIKKGLKGIEANYPTFSEIEKEKYRQIARKYNLFITGGSDFHGGNREEIELGDEGVSEIEYEIIKKS